MNARTLIVFLAGLAATTQARAQSPDWNAATRVEVDLSSFRFSPDKVVLRHGQPYVLHLVNRAGGGHDFTARTFFAAATVAPQDRAIVADGEVELGGGETADIHLIAPAAGHYDLHCGHFMHSALGMKGAIDVR